MASIWNPWHGCHKLSAGCMHCYVYMGDQKRGVDSTVVTRTRNYDLPVMKKRNGSYKIAPGTEMATCFRSDFFLEDADEWRPEAWEMIRTRNDLHFLIITKRIDRFHVGLPHDWGDGWDHVTICCTVENQDRADYRLPLYREAPIKRKMIICEPILERINLEPYLEPWVKQVVVGGESGKEARVCHYEWIEEIHDLCKQRNISFWFKQTGAKFMKDGTLYQQRLQHLQAMKAEMNINVLRH